MFTVLKKYVILVNSNLLYRLVYLTPKYEKYMLSYKLGHFEVSKKFLHFLRKSLKIEILLYKNGKIMKMIIKIRKTNEL